MPCSGFSNSLQSLQVYADVRFGLQMLSHSHLPLEIRPTFIRLLSQDPFVREMKHKKALPIMGDKPVANLFLLAQ